MASINESASEPGFFGSGSLSESTFSTYRRADFLLGSDAETSFSARLCSRRSSLAFRSRSLSSWATRAFTCWPMGRMNGKVVLGHSSAFLISGSAVSGCFERVGSE